MEAPTYIRNHEAVLSFFGRWPSFHDAHVVAYQMEEGGDVIELTLHTWLMTDEVDATGHFWLRNHALVAFRFEGLNDVRMNDFNTGNILFGMDLRPCPERAAFHVELDSVMDMSGSFTALVGEVVSVVPCTADGKTV